MTRPDARGAARVAPLVAALLTTALVAWIAAASAQASDPADATPAAEPYAAQQARVEAETMASLVELGFPRPGADELVHVPPPIEALETSGLHPELQRVIRRGYDLFMNTQQLRGEHVFNDMECASCHLGEGRLPYSAPVWPAAVTLPDFRGKNGHVNSLEERIAGCFSYSMNGVPPAYGSDDMVALSAYHEWLAKGVERYPDRPIYGRGYLTPPEVEDVSYARGAEVYEAQCQVCHGDDGAATYAGDRQVVPALWGDGSNNWGAGIVRLPKAAGFVHANMPLGKPLSLTPQESWDVALYVTSQDRPQDPRWDGSLDATLERLGDTFHAASRYGTPHPETGERLGDHENLGERPVLRPFNLRPRTFD